MKQYDYAIFDLDGTLLDTKDGVIAAAVQIIKNNNRTIPDDEEIESLIGPPMQDSFRKLYNISHDEAMNMANEFRMLYKKDEFLFKAKPYRGIFELMETLSNSAVEIGIATYKREDYAKRLMYEKGFNKYTDYIFGSDFEGKYKKQDIIEKCLKEMKCFDYSKAVYIGDGVSDGNGAKFLGIPFIAVTYGYGFKSKEDVKDYNPVGVASSCSDIKRLVIGK